MPPALLQVHEGQLGPIDPEPSPPPLPGGAAEVVRFFMDVPQWLQIGGAVVAVVALGAASFLVWRHRTRIGERLRALPSAVKVAALAVLVAGGAVASVAGYQVYDFVEHDNRFCTGCHVMADAYVRFLESPHAELGCKDCHAQPRTESARQLYLWVLERPEEVGPHSPVPDARCTSCHVDGDPESWPQIAASLGHRAHFESDEPELGELMCVTCHGVSVHRFVPARETCGDCHGAEVEIRLGGMAAETELHCIACHDFLAERPVRLADRPEAIALLPDRPQCAACHEMRAILRDEELDQDPHGAVCGACHNPHAQRTSAEAVDTCLGCHERADTITVFHTGTHAPVLPRCTACHSAHRWSVEGSDCLSCHETVMDGGPTPASRAVFPDPSESPNPPVVRLASREWASLALHGVGNLEGIAERARLGTPSPPDTARRPFLHREHQALSCTECHGRAGEHGVVTVRTARECAACHHDPRRGYECEACHEPTGPAGLRPVASTMAFTVREEPVTRDLPFDHAAHEGLGCQECHTGPVMLAVEVGCAACHEDHHRPEMDCARCHLQAEPGVHGLEVHLTCTTSGCHTGAAGERPPLTRTFCLACHQDQREHEPGLECRACHMVPDPAPRPFGSEAAGVPPPFPEL